jgi:hypothetical protein
MYSIHKKYTPQKSAIIIVTKRGVPVAGIHSNWSQTHDSFIVSKSYSTLKPGFGLFLYRSLFSMFPNKYFCPDRSVCLPKAFNIWNKIYHIGFGISCHEFNTGYWIKNPDHKILNYRYILESTEKPVSLFNEKPITDCLLDSSISLFREVYRAELHSLKERAKTPYNPRV